jgi:hypothetical protein
MVATDLRAVRSLAPVAICLAAMIVLEWWPFSFAIDPAHVGVQQTAWSRAPWRMPASPFDVLPGAILAAVAGVSMRARLSGQLVRLKRLLIVAGAAGVFLALEMGHVLLVGGRPTLVSVLIKEAALLIGLLSGSGPTAPIHEMAHAAGVD